MNDQEDQAVTILEAARRLLDKDDRAAYLDMACRNDSPLRQRIDSMLEAVDEADQYFEKVPNVIPPVEATSAETVEVRPISEGPGTVIGEYKLLQQIGEGGFGVVFMAEQEHPVRRKVALKIIKLGMDTKQVVARFEAERQALALMDHPNIAKILGAGSTQSGRPYFCMELVNGLPITQFCDENLISTEERLNLFIKIE